MGGGTFDARAYQAFTSSTVGKTTEQIYTSYYMPKSLDPKGVNRESRDSVDNPRSTPVIIDIDVTGSMGILADTIARKGLGTVFTGILDRKPISNPHVMFMANGDASCDRAPLQVSQFEADNRIIEQLVQIWIEGGGGGNQHESYDLPWYFAGLHTFHDSIEKRGKRGYLFTVGDEPAPEFLTGEQIYRFIGDQGNTGEKGLTVSSRESLELAQRKYDVYHIVIKEGSYASRDLDQVVSTWRPLLGQKLILLDDHTKLAETIVSAIEVAEGIDAEESAHRWGSGTAAIVHEAVRSLPKSRGPRLLGGPA